jgi:hypothetical protein
MEKLLKLLGLSYSTRHHLKAKIRHIDWTFLAAATALIICTILVLRYLR